MDLGPSLETLGLDGLADISLKELESKIHHIHSDLLSRQSVLQTLMGWLHECIKRDIQQKSSLSEFVNLLLTGGNLQRDPFSKDEVEAALKEWQIKDAAENHANIRRYQMIWLDIQELFEQTRHGPESVTGSLLKPSSRDQEEKYCTSRQALRGSRATTNTHDDEESYPRLVTGGRQKTGANEIPLGPKAPSSIHHEETKAREEYTPSTESTPRDFPWNMPRQFAAPPPRGYACKRCGRPGHWIQLCPTNLDPGWDQPPPPDYRCELCKALGKHFATLCPRNEYELSLTQQRRRAQAQQEAPQREKYSRYRDRMPQTPSPRSRSRSPVNHTRRKRHDIYRPDESPRAWRHDSSSRYQSYTDRGSISPWSNRERMTRESYRKGDSSGEHTPSSYHLRKRSATPAHDYRRRAKAPPPEERRRPFLELERTKKEENEGRLGYDNDEFIGSNPFPEPSKKCVLSQKRVSNENGVKVEAMIEAPFASDNLEEMERAKKEADEFLDALAIKLLSGNAKKPSPMPSISPKKGGTISDATDRLSNDATINGDENKDGYLVGDKLASTKTTGQYLQETRLRPEVSSLFRDRVNPIVHSKANRETAKDVIEKAWDPMRQRRLI